MAQNYLAELRIDAAELSKEILTKLVESFDAELQEVAVAAEERLKASGITLCKQGDFELWHMTEVTYRHSWREIARHKLQQFDHSAADIAIGCIQWLCTDEDGVPFQWLG